MHEDKFKVLQLTPAECYVFSYIYPCFGTKAVNFLHFSRLNVFSSPFDGSAEIHRMYQISNTNCFVSPRLNQYTISSGEVVQAIGFRSAGNLTLTCRANIACIFGKPDR